MWRDNMKFAQFRHQRIKKLVWRSYSNKLAKAWEIWQGYSNTVNA